MLFSILFSTGDSSFQEWRDDFDSYETAIFVYNCILNKNIMGKINKKNDFVVKKLLYLPC